MRIDNMQSLDASFRSLYRTAKLMLENGKMVLAEVTEFKPRRTKAQNDYYWVFCEELAKFLQEKGIMHKYTFLGKELEKHFTKDSVHTELNKPMFGLETTTKLSIGEFCDYMNKLIAEYTQMTKGAFQMSETPENYLHRKGY